MGFGAVTFAAIRMAERPSSHPLIPGIVAGAAIALWIFALTVLTKKHT